MFVHPELGRGDAGLDDAIDGDVPAFDRQAAERVRQRLERHARVE
jgi:hypothetical protein